MSASLKKEERHKKLEQVLKNNLKKRKAFQNKVKKKLKVDK